jgi:putative aldouronate transport system permease protein
LGDTGMSSAAGLYQAVVGFVLVVSVNFLVRKIDKENALF